MIIVGIDPGFANFGWAIIEVTKKNGELRDSLIDAGVVVTRKSNKKRRLASCDDLVLRIRKLRTHFVGLSYERPAKRASRRAPDAVRTCSALSECVFVASEAMSWGFKGIRAHRQMGMAWGVITCVLDEQRRPLVTVTPQELKEAITGDPNSSKIAVREALYKRPGYEQFEALINSHAKARHEHMGDAVGAAIASLQTDAARFFSDRP